MVTLSTVFKSRTTWTVVAMFVIGGVQNVVPFMPASVSDTVQGVLALAAMYFHVNPSQVYNQPKGD